MSTTPKQNTAKLLELFDRVFADGDVDAADDLIREDRPDHDTNLPPDMLVGRDGFKLFARAFGEAMSNAEFVSNFTVADGDMVVSYNTVRGTQTGEFFGMPASNRSFEIPSADFCRFDDDGLIAEHWGVLDMLGLLRQLGFAEPAPWQDQ